MASFLSCDWACHRHIGQLICTNAGWICYVNAAFFPDLESTKKEDGGEHVAADVLLRLFGPEQIIAKQITCSEGSTLLPDFIFLGPILIISEYFHIVGDSSRKENDWNLSVLLGYYSAYIAKIKQCWFKLGFAFHECVIPLCCV